MILAIAALLLQIHQTPTALSTNEPASASVAAAEVAEVAVSNDAGNSVGGSETAVESTPIHWNLDLVTFDKPSLTLDKGDKSTAKGPALASLNNVSLSDAQKQGISTVRIPDPEPAKPIQMTPAETLHPSRAWLALSFVQHSAATFDAYSTRQAIGRGAVESDPIMRPFAHSGALYGAIQVGPVLLDFVARRMQRSENNFFRRMWWMPQSVATAGFLFSGVHNMGVPSNLKH
jgi:hypothetical protein